ncbi:WXG100 family type VII secretion target [Saccharopolyspora mangrovi]|uniref:Putative T7SS secretion signal domain-containing protein n=1 Tax=Saccharopolyspora mangrovi TaxID=3082379 RepID=A0ABU6A836_9PSEU|nr:hypothetical protein [Saccharopolyspora sp. S2-29]MEB3367654.1 hypothetical protein [Saccharopolyspora sp. S2-29]
MAELGQTSDPKALIPGEADSVDDTVRKLRRQSEEFGAVGDRLKRVDVVGWTGEASHAFMDLFSKEPPKWLKVSDLLDSASKSLTEYASTLRWAQGQAAEAIARWEEGESATAKAVAEYNAAVDQANAQNQANAAAGRPGGVLGSGRTPQACAPAARGFWEASRRTDWAATVAGTWPSR